MALEAVKRIDALFEIERDLSVKPTEQRLAARSERSAALAVALEAWAHEEGASSRGTATSRVPSTIC